MYQKFSALIGPGSKSEQQKKPSAFLLEPTSESMGAVKAFIKLTELSKTKPGLNCLYAMVGALENVHWTKK